MKIILNKRKLINILKHKRDLGFVPTMGSIHKGHISLIKKSIKLSQKTIVSIFINKHQFNRNIDYQKYRICWNQKIQFVLRREITIRESCADEALAPDQWSGNGRLCGRAPRRADPPRPQSADLAGVHYGLRRRALGLVVLPATNLGVDSIQMG